MSLVGLNEAIIINENRHNTDIAPVGKLTEDLIRLISKLIWPPHLPFFGRLKL